MVVARFLQVWKRGHEMLETAWGYNILCGMNWWKILTCLAEWKNKNKNKYHQLGWHVMNYHLRYLVWKANIDSVKLTNLGNHRSCEFLTMEFLIRIIFFRFGIFFKYYCDSLSGRWRKCETCFKTPFHHHINELVKSCFSSQNKCNLNEQN